MQGVVFQQLVLQFSKVSCTILAHFTQNCLSVSVRKGKQKNLNNNQNKLFIFNQNHNFRKNFDLTRKIGCFMVHN